MRMVKRKIAIQRWLTPEAVRRFKARVDRRGQSQCWLFVGPPMGEGDADGCGVFCLGGRYLRPSRVALTIALGRDLGEANVRHKCRNRKCCNPAHLYEHGPGSAY